MPYNTKPLLTDVTKLKPIPQRWDPVIDDYRPFAGGIEIQNGWKVATIVVGTEPVELKTGLPGRRKMIIIAIGSDCIFLGPNNLVTTETGYPVLVGKPFPIAFDPMASASVYAVAQSNHTVKILEVN